MSQHLQAIATLFSLVNPVVCAMMFAGIVAGQGRGAALRAATGAMATVAAVLVAAAFGGAPLLKLFGISLDAFSVAGGGVLVFIGIAMLQGSMAPPAPSPAGAATTDAATAGAGTPASLSHLVLFAASPGTITGVMTIVAAHRRGAIPVTALVAIATVVGVTWLLLLATARSPRPSKPGLGRDMASRYMGLIIIAMGIQFALTGLKAFFSG